MLITKFRKILLIKSLNKYYKIKATKIDTQSQIDLIQF